MALTKDNESFTFLMPDEDVTVTATFLPERISVVSYNNINKVVGVGEGTITSDVASQRVAKTVHLTVTPGEGYETAGVIIMAERVSDRGKDDLIAYQDAANSASWSFVMPDYGVNAIAVFKKPGESIITYDPNAGYFSDRDCIPVQSVNTDNEVTLNVPAVARPGYTFTGWNTFPNGTGTTYGNGNSITVSNNTKLYAQWTINDWGKLQAVIDGTGVYEDVAVRSDNTITLHKDVSSEKTDKPLKIASDADIVFDLSSHSLSIDGTGNDTHDTLIDNCGNAVIKNGSLHCHFESPFSSGVIKNSGNLELNDIAINLEAKINGAGIYNTTNASLKYSNLTVDGKNRKSKAIFCSDGTLYLDAGLVTQNCIYDVQYKSDNPIVITQPLGSKEFSIYFQYRECSGLLTRGLSGNGTVSNFKLVTIEGYNYSGNVITTSDGEIAVPRPTNIYFDKNGGSGIMTAQSANSFADVVINANTFNPPAGKTFSHWNTKKDNTGTRYEDGGVIVLNNNGCTLYAQWKDEASYTVSFDGNAPVGVEVSGLPTPLTVTGGSTAAKPADNPTAEGYTFDGWYETKDCSGDPFDFNTAITADKSLYARWTEKAKIPVTVTSKDTDGNNVAAALEINGASTATGIYTEGTEVTVVAPVVTNYTFQGWYEKADSSPGYTGNAISTARSYRFSATQNTDLVAVYKGIGNVNITINGGGSNYTVNGGNATSTQTTTAYQVGSTLKIKVLNTEDFDYWENAAGMIVSRNPEYSFTVSVADTLTAVYKKPAEGSMIVVWESSYGQVMGRVEGNADTIHLATVPELPTRFGYNVTGWDTDVRTLTFAAGTLVTIRPVETKMETGVNVSVTNGTKDKDSYLLNDVVTVTANAPAAGKKFSHWTDGTGKIISYNSTYIFYITEDVSLTANYVDDEVAVEEKGTAQIISTSYDADKKYLNIVSMLTEPDNCTMNFAGLVATSNSEAAANLTKENAAFVRGTANTGNKSYRYSWTKSKVEAGAVWYVRAYLVYTNASGEVIEVYGDLQTVTAGNN